MDYYFDTDRFVADATYGMIDPYGEGRLLIQGVGLSGGGHAYGNTLDMSITDGIPVINSISSGIGNGYQRMYVLGAQGNFQFGTCPSIRPSCRDVFRFELHDHGTPWPRCGSSSGPNCRRRDSRPLDSNCRLHRLAPQPPLGRGLIVFLG